MTHNVHLLVAFVLFFPLSCSFLFWSQNILLSNAIFMQYPSQLLLQSISAEQGFGAVYVSISTPECLFNPGHPRCCRLACREDKATAFRAEPRTKNPSSVCRQSPLYHEAFDGQGSSMDTNSMPAPDGGTHGNAAGRVLGLSEKQTLPRNCLRSVMSGALPSILFPIITQQSHLDFWNVTVSTQRPGSDEVIIPSCHPFLFRLV